jgi:polysaccharide deacetylase 2 family uncharacterized protein YibQ
MAKGPKRTARGGRSATRSRTARTAPASLGIRLDALVARTTALWRGGADALASRRTGFGIVALLALMLAGIGGGYWLAQRFAGPPATNARPKYASIDDLPDLPKYSEAEGRRRPVYEQRAPALAPPRRPLPDATWARNAIAFQDDRTRPLVVIVIDDMGLDQPRSRRIAELPAPLTLSYLPYARELGGQARAARGRGHELMLHLPMEPLSGVLDPGPGPLLTTLSEEAIRRRTVAALESFTGYVAVNNHMGSRFTTWRPGVEAALAQMHARGLAWLDSRTHAQSVGGLVAEELGMPHVDRHVFLDDVDSVEAVRQQLTETERLARRQGVAIAIGHPHDATIQALAAWLPTLRDKGFLQGPVSAAIKRQDRWDQTRAD